MTADIAQSVTSEMREIRRRVRAIPGLTVRKLLARAGISYSTWWRWEQYTLGRPAGQVPRMDRLDALKAALRECEADGEGAGVAEGGYVYLASAYTGHPGGHEKAFEAACIAASAVIHSGRAVYCPIAHSHPISEHGVLDADEHDLWMEANHPLLLTAAELWVLCDIHGAWRESAGVQQETRIAEAEGIPVRYLVPRPRIHEETAERPLLGYELESAEPVAA